MHDNSELDIERMVKARRGEIRKDESDTEDVLNDMERITNRMDSAFQTFGDALDSLEHCHGELVAIHGSERLARIGFEDEFRDAMTTLERLYDELEEARMLPVRLAQTFSRRIQ